MRRALRLVHATTALLFAGSVAQAQGRGQASEPAHAVCAPGDHRFLPATCTIYRAILDSAVKQNVPVGPLQDKALQGYASESDDSTILAAIQRLRANLYTARQVMGAGATDRELKAAASVLDAGANAQQLGMLWTARTPHTRSLETVFTVLVELSAQVPMAEAVAGVKYMLQVAVSDAEFQGYQRSVQSQIALGGDPTIVANRLARAFLPIPHK